MGDSENRRNQGLAGQRFELNLYLLFLHQGVSNEKYNEFILHREKEDAGKFDDLVFEFKENGKTVYRLFQAKHTITPEKKKISEGQLFSSMQGEFDLVKYFVSYRDAMKKYSKKGKLKDCVICTNRSLDENFKSEIETDMKEDDILDVVKENGERPKRFHIQGTDEIIKTVENEYKARKKVWESKTKKHWPQSDPSPEEIRDYLKALTFTTDMPNQDELGVIIKNKIGKDFNEKARQDIYIRACKRMENWMVGTDPRQFWTHHDAKAMFDEVKAGYIFPRDVRYNIQPPVSMFTGRNEHLETMHKLLRKHKRVMISGLGGVGKTELVRKYIEMNSDKYYNNILWINAESDMALENSFRSLASDKLSIKTKNANDEEKNIKVVIAEVYQWFEQSKSLFIFENAEWEHYPTHIRPFLPKNVSEPYLIVTSRRKWKNGSIIKTMELSVFTESEAIGFIRDSLSKYLNNDRQLDSMKKLAEILQYLPLALTQAIAYITVEFEYEPGTYQIAEYIKNFSLESEEYLDYDFSDYCESGYAKTVWTTWNITVEALKRKEAYTLNVLNCVSFLLSDNIRSELLEILLEEREKLKKAIRLLNEYSLVTVREKVYNVHRLVQLVTRKKLDCDKKRQVLEGILGTLVQNDDVIVSRNIDHFSCAWTYFKGDRNESVEKYYHVPATIAIVLFDIGRYKKAFIMGIEALELINCFPIDNEERQQYVQNLTPIVVKVLCNSGKCEEALNKSKQIWEILKDMNKRFPYTVPILTIENDIATMYLSMRDFDAAGKLLYESPLKNDPCSEKYHDIAMIRKEIMADSWVFFHEYDRAALEYQDLLNERKGSSKTSDPGILRISKKIARTIYEVHLYEKVIKFSPKINLRLNLRNEVLLILREAHEEQKQKLPNNHSERLETQESITCLLIEQGKYKEALTLFEKISDDGLSRNNCSLLTKKATVLALLNKNDRALAICKDLKKDISKIESGNFKINYPDVVDRCVGVALVLSLLREFDEAIKILGDVWNRLKYSVSFYNVYVARVLIIIGHVYLMHDKRVQGLSTFEELWECYKHVPYLYFWMPQALRIFTDVLFNERQLDSALRRDLELIEIYKTSPELSQQLTWRIKRRVAQLFVAKKDYEKALSMLAEVKNSQENSLKKDDPVYQATCNFINHINNKKALDKWYQSKKLTTKDPFEVVKRGNLEQLEKLITDGVDVNAADENKWTLLHHAASVGKPEITAYLLHMGADATRVTGKFRNTALHIAVRRNHVAIVMLLLNFHFDKPKTVINAKTKVSGSTALHIASRKGLLEIARVLLAQGAAYDAKNKAGKSPLEMARGIVVEALLREVHDRFQSLINPGNSRAFELLENCPGKQYRAVFRARNSEGCSLFKLAVANNCNALVESILGLDEDEYVVCVNMPLDCVYLLLQYDETISSILRSDYTDRIECVKRIKILLEPLRLFRNIFTDYFSSTLNDMFDILAQDELANEVEKLAKFVVEEVVKKIFKMLYGAALLDAARLGNMEAFNLCLDKQPDLAMIDAAHRTAFHYAAEAGNEAMVKLLLDEDTNVFRKMRVPPREYPLLLATGNGHVGVARLLLRNDRECIYQSTQENGDTALHLAARNGHLEMVKLLLENNAECGTRNEAGETPPDLAASREVKDLFGLIDELHADEDVDRVLERLNGFEPAGRRPLLNAVDPDGKQLWQVLAGKRTDQKKLLDVIGEQIEVDSKFQAELARKLLDLMLEVAANKNNYCRD